jgi:hypothetical protein
MNVPTGLKDKDSNTQRWKYEVSVPGTTIKALRSSNATLAVVAGVSFIAGAAVGLLWNAMRVMN